MISAKPLYRASNLSHAQFRHKKDPGSNVRSVPHFSSPPGKSMTMGISKAKLPKPPQVHPHSAANAKRSHRAR